MEINLTHAPVNNHWIADTNADVSVLSLPVDGKMPSTSFHVCHNVLNIQLIQKLQKACVAHNTNLFNMMLAAYVIWLHRVCNENDIALAVGTDASSDFVAVRVLLENDDNAQTVLERIGMELDFMHEHEKVVADRVKDLFYNKQSVKVGFGNSKHFVPNFVQLYLSVNFKKCNIQMYYDTGLFEQTTVHHFLEQYMNVLESLSQTVQTPVGAIEIVCDEERELYQNINNTQRTFAAEKTIPQVFAEIVSKHSNKVAVFDGHVQYTYAQLDELSNQVANMLLENGLKVGQMVPIFMERNPQTIISLLGIIKAGGAYVPLDPEHPEERNAHILQDIDAQCAITKRKYVDTLTKLAGQSLKAILCIDEDLDKYSKDPVNVLLQPNDLAYVIYTSGSTGKPKGTLLPHVGVINLCTWIHEQAGISDQDVITQFATYSFDASVYDTFGALFNGATLYLLSNEERMSVEAFAEAIERTQATCIAILPTIFFNQLAVHLPDTYVPKLRSVKRLAVGGEALTGEVVRAFQRKFGTSIEIYNMYGPTECTVAATGHKIDYLVPEDMVNVPIGKPLYNYQVYIVNDKNQLCPINVPGEIVIGTVGIAHGYLNQPEKTAESFVDMTIPGSVYTKFYKSGDIARLLPDGNIEYLSRKDSQVKIRGHRVEIGEVEDNFARHPDVQDVAVIAKKEGLETVLAAFYTTKDKQPIAHGRLVHFLQQNLPKYMIPAYIQHLEQMPVSPTGKIDRKKLATFETNAKVSLNEYVAPRNPVEQLVADAWAKVLKLDKVGVHDNFFEIGGHSLKILEALVIIKPHHPNLKIGDFFVYPTVKQLAQRICELDGTTSHMQQELATDFQMLAEYPVLPKMDGPVVAVQDHILLTGATGYLGSHVLKRLLDVTDATVYCLVRASANQDPYTRLVNMMAHYFGEDIVSKLQNRVYVVAGDLKEENLGLSLEDWNMLAERVNSIIHCGADVRHFGDAQHFNRVNAQSIENLLKLARCKPGTRFHHISTLGIPEDLAYAGLWDTVVKENKLPAGAVLENVYTNSKLQAEQILIKAYEDGVPVTIYRAGNLSSRTDGMFQKNIDDNAFYRMFKAMMLLGKAPDVSWMVDFTPIDFASEAIVALAMDANTCGHIFHICNFEQIPFHQVVSHFHKLGHKIDLVPMDEYTQWLLDPNAQKDAEGVQLAMAQLEGDGAKNSPFVFANPTTQKFLERLGVQCPKADFGYFEKMLAHATQVGYFKPFGEGRG